jgi:2-methylcitrate dehydratase PrpD
MKRLHAGRSAESGARMAQLAARDFTAPPSALDGHFGLLEVFGGAGAQPAELTRDLGKRWAMERIFVKLHPCCGWVQSTIDAATQLRGPKPLDPSAVQHVKIGVSPYVTKNNGAVSPPDTMGAQYSIPYCAALALTADADDFSLYEGDALHNPARRALAQRVQLALDPDAEALYPHHSAVRFELTLANGEQRKLFLADPKGAADNPCNDEELLAKFARLSSRVISADAVRALQTAIVASDQAKSTRDFMATLREQSAAEGRIQ